MKYLLLTLTLALTAAVSNADSRDKQNKTRDTSKVVAQSDPLDASPVSLPPAYQPSAPRAWEITHTQVALTFNFKERTANGQEHVYMRPYFYPCDSVVFDAKSMEIQSVERVDKGKTTRLKYAYKDNKLTVWLGQLLTSKDSICLSMQYKAMPYATASGGSAAITEDRGLYFINTDNKMPCKPVQIWTQGETEANSHWLITIDKPNTRFTTEVALTVPDTMTTLGNGKLARQTTKNGLRTDTWVMDKPIQAYVVMFAIGKFSVIKDSWRGKEVNYYVEPRYAPYAKQTFCNTPEMIEYFSEFTGVPYPWNKYSQVVVRDYVSGAMENTSASLFGEFMNGTAREMIDRKSEDIVSHELFHQWFGDYVTCESWSNITVNESFANYGEQLWRRHKYGKDNADELAWSDLQLYNQASSMNDPQLVRFYYDNKEEVFDAISYNKGGATLRYLNYLMGDDAFSLAMKLYLTKNALHSGEAHQWRLAVEEATGLDWNWFFNEWYFHKGHPILKVTQNYSDSLHSLEVKIAQVDTAFTYNLPLKYALIYGDKKQIIDWTMNSQRDSFTFAYQGDTKPVFVADAAHVLPGEIRDSKKPWQFMAQFKNGGSYIDKRIALYGAYKQISDTLSQKILTMGIEDPMASIRKYTIGLLSNSQSEKYHKKWGDKMIAIAQTDKDQSVKSAAYELLSEWKLKQSKSLFLNSLYDSSYVVAGYSLSGINELDKDTAYVLAKKLLETKPRSTLESSIWQILGQNAKDADIKLYEDKSMTLFGSQKYGFAYSLTAYEKHVTSDASYARGMAIFKYMATIEESKQIRQAMFGYTLQLGKDQKENTKSEVKEDAATANKRLDVVLKTLDMIIAEETDKELVESYKKKKKAAFEDN